MTILVGRVVGVFAGDRLRGVLPPRVVFLTTGPEKGARGFRQGDWDSVLGGRYSLCENRNGYYITYGVAPKGFWEAYGEAH